MFVKLLIVLSNLFETAPNEDLWLLILFIAPSITSSADPAPATVPMLIAPTALNDELKEVAVEPEPPNIFAAVAVKSNVSEDVNLIFPATVTESVEVSIKVVASSPVAAAEPSKSYPWTVAVAEASPEFV